MSETLRILQIEDNPLDAELVEEVLRQQWPECEHVLVDSEQSLRQTLKKSGFDVVLSDYSLPMFDGLSALDIVLDQVTFTPFIFVTGAIGEEMAIETLKSGATDYVLKNNLKRLVPSIQRAMNESLKLKQLRRTELEEKKLLHELQVVMSEYAAQNLSLAESELRFRAVLENMQLIAITLDRDLTVTFCNDYLLQLTGYDREEVVAHNWFERFVPVESDVHQLFRSAVQQERFFITHHQNEIVTRSGEHRLIKWNNTAIMKDGRITAITCIGEDITVHSKALQLLKESEERFRTIFDSINDALFVQDLANGAIVDVNRRMLEMFGYSRDEALKLSFEDLSSGDPDFSGEEARLRFCRAVSGEPQLIEWKTKDTSGRVFWVEVNMRTASVSGCERMLVTVRDISERKRVEDELRHVQAQMIQQDKLATIGQLAAGVAHEINNPVGYISSNLVTLTRYVDKYKQYIELLEQSLDASTIDALRGTRDSLDIDYVNRDIVQLVEDCNDGIERVKKIVQDLKIFSRNDTAAAGVADLNRCMESTINIVFNEIKFVADLKREYDDQLPQVSCNMQQVNQVFLNLLVNAVHAIQARGENKLGVITVRSWSNTANVFVSVSDTGCGIEPANIKHIFEAFFTTKEIGKGTGLGLSISAEIIRKHGGDIMVASEPGSGTTFTVRLPIHRSPQADKGR